jgi:hypothetical protein
MPRENESGASRAQRVMGYAPIDAKRLLAILFVNCESLTIPTMQEIALAAKAGVQPALGRASLDEPKADKSRR